MVPVRPRARDRVRDLRGGGGADAHVAEAGDVGPLRAHAAEDAEGAEAGLTLDVAGGDLLGGAAGGAEGVAGAEVEVLGPKGGVADIFVGGVGVDEGQATTVGGAEGVDVGERGGHRGGGGLVGPLPAAADLAHLLVAKEGARLDRGGDGGGEAVGSVEARVEDVDVPVVVAGGERHGRAVTRDIEEAGAGSLGEDGVRAVGGVDDPADVGRAHHEVAAGLVGEVVVRPAVAGVVVESQAVERVFGGTADEAGAVDEAAQEGVELEVGARDGAHLGAGVGVARDDRAGAGERAIGEGGDRLVGEGARGVEAVRLLEGVVVDRVQREPGAVREAVLHLGVEALLRAVVVLVLGAEVPEEDRPGGAVLVVELPRGRAVRVLAVEEIQRHAQVALAAGHTEHFLVGDVSERVNRVVAAGLDVVEERGRPARAEAVREPAPLLHPERRAGLQVDRAAQRVRSLVWGVALDHLELLEHRAREAVGLELPVEAADVGHQVPVNVDAVERRSGAADEDARDVALVVELRGHAGETDGKLARAHIREVPVGVEGRDVLEVVGVALGGEGQRVALALAGDPELAESVDGGGKVEVLGAASGRGDSHDPPLVIEPKVGDHQFDGSGRKAVEHVTARGIGEGGAAGRRGGNAGALQEVAGGGVTDRARDGAGGGRNQGKGEGG